MHIHQPTSFQQTLQHSLQVSGGVCPLWSPGPGRGALHRRQPGARGWWAAGEGAVHGLLLSATSPFLATLLSGTPPGLEHTLLLPSTLPPALAALTSLLYGEPLLLPRPALEQLRQLLDLLHIQLSLQEEEQQEAIKMTEPSEQKPEEEQETEHSPSKEQEDPGARMLKLDDARSVTPPPHSSVLQEEEVTSPSPPRPAPPQVATTALPLCCWHCHKDFPSFPQLCHHLQHLHPGQVSGS